MANFISPLQMNFTPAKQMDIQGDFINCTFIPNTDYLMLTQAKHRGIYLYDLNSNKLKMITEDYGAGYRPGISEDGNRIVYKATSQNLYRLFAFDLEENNTTELRPSSNLIGQPWISKRGNIYVNYEGQLQVLSPDGELKDIIGGIKSNIVIMTPSEEYLIYTSLSDQLWIYRFKDKKHIQLTPDGMRFFSPLPSPTKEQIVANQLGGSIYVIDIPKGTLTEIDRGDYYYFSPDGEGIFFTKTTDDGEYITSGELYYKPIKGEKSKKLEVGYKGIKLASSYNKKWGLAFVTDKGSVYLSSNRK